MATKLYQRCCRICMDDTKKQQDILSDAALVETLQQLYNVKVDQNDRITKKICVDCVQEANETHKWLKFYEEQKQLITENQRIYNEELVNQFGPENDTDSPALSTSSIKTGRSSRTRQATRRITDDDDEEEVKGEKDEDFIPSKSPRTIKKEAGTRSRSKVKREWVPSTDGSERESTTTTPTEQGTEDDEDDGHEEEEGSETGTSTSDGELKCPKCEKVFAEIDQLERHNCEFICNICSASVKYRHSLKRHMVTVHKINPNQWENYWNPTGDQPGDSLLVETSKPRKRYRYESDSPTDMEDDSNTDENEQDKDLICSRCGDKFYSTQEMKNHDCECQCNICGVKFASRNSVKRHKIRLHNVDPNDPSVAPRSRAPSTTPTVATSRPPSRPPSRAASDNSDDEPLASLASEDMRYRYFCPSCDYSSYKRCTVTSHLVSFHKTRRELIDVETIPKKFVPRNASFGRAKTPVCEAPPSRPMTPKAVEPPAPPRSKTPSPVESVPLRSKTPEPVKTYRPPSTHPIPPTKEYQPVAQIFPVQHRSRSRSIHQDSQNSSKRKRSLSACSNKSSRAVRARSNPPSDRHILTAKRRLSPSRALASVHEKFRPTVTGIQANRLFVSIRQGCEPSQPGQQIRFRASSYLLQDPCPTKRLFRLRAPVGTERQQVQNLRGVFNKLSHQISSHSKVNEIDVDSLVLDYIHPPKAAVKAVVDPLEKEEGTTFEIRELDTEETTEVIVPEDPEPDDDAEPRMVIVTEDDGQTAEKNPLEDVTENGTNGKGEDAVEPVEVEDTTNQEKEADPIAPESSPEERASESPDGDEEGGEDEDVSITPD
nr:uncharacterized protein LOC109400795 [Aedes albopictus]